MAIKCLWSASAVQPVQACLQLHGKQFQAKDDIAMEARFYRYAVQVRA
jgi:hypothetical protein